jgi:glycosyltransferase involved in cell wall biosynthesis
LEFLGTVDRARKLAMLESLDVLSVPTTYREPKGLYVLEALAAGVPVVVPRHGAFPEILADVGGGELVAPDRVDDLTRVLAELLCDPQRRRQLAATGRAAVLERRSAAAMAQTTGAVLQLYLDRNRSGT